MELKAYAVYSHALDEDINGRQVVVIDVLRATTVMITALANGCAKVVPAAEIEEAMDIHRRLQKDAAVLGGERDLLQIPGFDVGNSPAEYTKELVKDKTVILATTNGTRAISRAKNASRIMIAAMANGSAVAKQVAESGRDTTIICAGTKGQYSLDDILTLGFIIAGIKKHNGRKALMMDDLCRASLFLYNSKHLHLREALKDSVHFRELSAAGFEADIRKCLEQDAYDLVPVYSDGEVTLQAP